MKRTLLVLIVLLMLPVITVSAYTGSIPLESNQLQPFEVEEEQTQARSLQPITKNIEPLYIDDISSFFERKLFEIVHLLQVLSQPITITIFIISSFMLLIGTVGSGYMAGKGLWGALLSPTIYALILYAQIVILSVVSWIST